MYSSELVYPGFIATGATAGLSSSAEVSPRSTAGQTSSATRGHRAITPNSSGSWAETAPGRRRSATPGPTRPRPGRRPIHARARPAAPHRRRRVLGTASAVISPVSTSPDAAGGHARVAGGIAGLPPAVGNQRTMPLEHHDHVAARRPIRRPPRSLAGRSSLWPIKRANSPGCGVNIRGPPRLRQHLAAAPPGHSGRRHRPPSAGRYRDRAGPPTRPSPASGPGPARRRPPVADWPAR